MDEFRVHFGHRAGTAALAWVEAAGAQPRRPGGQSGGEGYFKGGGDSIFQGEGGCSHAEVSRPRRRGTQRGWVLRGGPPAVGLDHSGREATSFQILSAVRTASEFQMKRQACREGGDAERLEIVKASNRVSLCHAARCTGTRSRFAWLIPTEGANV